MGDIGEKYLINVTTQNNNKYYRMIPAEDGQSFRVEYGRVGASCQTATYPINKWTAKYREKIRKGYVDQTELHIASSAETGKPAEPKFIPISDEVIRELITFLQQCSAQVVQRNYRISSREVTKAMVDAAQAQMDLLVRGQNDNMALGQFNKLLLDLFTIIPRKMGSVNEHLAHEKNDIGKILSAEQELLDVMIGEVKAQEAALKLQNPDVSAEDKPKMTVLDAMGIEIVPVTADEIKFIKKHLGKESEGLFHNAWKVVNRKTQSLYDSYMEKQAPDYEVKYLWHGSRNENWISIMQTGLLLRPSAHITGKMFGSGIYFAPRAKKSIGYTSLSGSYWAGGQSNRAFMALFEVAYGKPFNVDDCTGIGYDFGYKDLQKMAPGTNCLHAHAGKALYNDEIIFYREDQLTMKYLVELRH